ncbi:MAG: HNH endonuclease [Thermogemmatispora sp.]|uniref:RNA-guided endonuclease IscB n=1 Tax=Thermogemmatispora sp. TaxID=1968838 RepID=UPI003437C10B|nr:HNH endonuclease [Thermogemmatispora sp.]
MQQRVLVVGKDRRPLMPCSPARARMLLKTGRAAILRRYPFTIILKGREGGEVQPVAVKCDPGSETTGVALVAEFGRRGRIVVWAAEIHHRGKQVQQALAERRALRRARRNRKTRYRKPRFLNRKPQKCDGCGKNARHGSRSCRLCKAGSGQGFRDKRLAPSLESRVGNVLTWVNRLCRYAPVSLITVEHVQFDTQLLQNPDISGVEYQQGTLFGYELREYLLEQFGHQCASCGGASGDTVLNIDHVIPRSRGGSDRVSNLAVVCRRCNEAKGNRMPEEWLGELNASVRPLDGIRAQRFPEALKRLKQPLQDAAAVNTVRWVIVERLKRLGLPLELGSGGRTKRNRSSQGYPKNHWIDAACAGASGERVRLDPDMRMLRIEAKGHGKRQRCITDKYGFPKSHAPSAKSSLGFRTGDLVRAHIPRGKYAGRHVGRIVIRHRPSFRLNGFDVHPKHLKLVQRGDGYAYSEG